MHLDIKYNWILIIGHCANKTVNVNNVWNINSILAHRHTIMTSIGCFWFVSSLADRGRITLTLSGWGWYTDLRIINVSEFTSFLKESSSVNRDVDFIDFGRFVDSVVCDGDTLDVDEPDFDAAVRDGDADERDVDGDDFDLVVDAHGLDGYWPNEYLCRRERIGYRCRGTTP